jgi:hypothetical protein
VTQFDGIQQVGVEDAGGISDTYALEAFLQFASLSTVFCISSGVR